MFLRKLTDEELDRIKKLKSAIKEQRQKLQAAIKNQRKRIQSETKRLKGKARDVDMFQPLKALQDHLCELQSQFNALPIITGLPVVVKVEGVFLCINYDLLQKFNRSLDKSNFWQYDFKIEGVSLIIHYKKHGQKGTFELFETPSYKTELLTDLPTIDLKE